MTKERILMVCLGNICRSPMAEGVLRYHLMKKRLDVEVDSAGTANYHVGDEPDHRAIRCMREKGIDISRLRGRQFSVNDFDAFDRIYVMDHSNYKNVINLAKNESHKAKVKLILDEVNPGNHAEVPDPWFGDMNDFDAVYNLLDVAANIITDEIANREE
jgi:protein-tyrosine phosphatase